jgi:hypothetical protein
MQQIFPTLKRWKEKDERSLTEKAIHLLSQCKEVTLASVNAEGFPRPVPLDKTHSLGRGKGIGAIVSDIVTE